MTYNTSNYESQGGASTTVGGTFNVLSTGQFQLAGTQVTATAAEINQVADVSSRLVAGGSTLALTVASHNGKLIQLDTATGTVVTLPAATGTGAIFDFVVSALATSNSHIVKVANASDTMAGFAFLVDTDTSGTVTAFATAASSDTITLNRSTTGSVTLGERIRVVDLATNKFAVEVYATNTASGATPFSATVS